MTVDVIFPKPFKKQNLQIQPKPVLPLPEEKKLNLDIVQTPLRSSSKMSEATTVETKTQSLPKLEDSPIEKKITLEIPDEKSLTERKEELNPLSNKLSPHASNIMNDTETVVSEKTYATIEADTNNKVEELKLLVSPEKSTKGEETTSQKIEIFSVEGYSDTENMW